jgi:hypothetical protein
MPLKRPTMALVSISLFPVVIFVLFSFFDRSRLDVNRQAAFTNSAELSGIQLAQFNDSVSGRLYRAIPFARSCFLKATTAGQQDSAQCAAVQQNYLTSSELHLDLPR